ncbi:MAG TPA: 8-oxo-dGTP diphosphatase MutT, partial [Cellvibrio sp.]
MNKLVHVAVGVIYRPDGNILIAKRPDSAHQGGLWEFPGGKVDAGETIQQALARELREELNIHVLASEPLIQIRHHYADKSVLLDVHRITRFAGEACGNEGQPIQWVDVEQLKGFEFPAANRPIISAINLPSTYAITGALTNEPDFIARVTNVLAAGVGILQLRIPNLSPVNHQELL